MAATKRTPARTGTPAPGKAKAKSGRSKAARKKTPRKSARKPAASKQPKSEEPPRASAFTDAVKLYETGFELINAEDFEKARDAFSTLVEALDADSAPANGPRGSASERKALMDRAQVMIHVCRKRIREAKKNIKLKSADDYYEVGVAEMNRRELDDALENLQHALKMSPRADHVLYALAAVSALRNERDEALEFLEKSIKYRDENRYLAINDPDFESLSDDPEFIQLITPDEG